MQTYPIAGQLLEQKFLFGISIHDLADVFSIPVVLMGFTAFTGLPDIYNTWVGGLGLVISFAVLYKTPPAQRPRHWVVAALRYYLGSNIYLNRPVERDRGRSAIQDVVLTFEDSP